MAAFGRIRTPQGETYDIVRLPWYLGPHVEGFRGCLGYWESRCELFCWACGVIGEDAETCLYEDPGTGELLDFWQLADEELFASSGRCDVIAA